MAISPMMKQYLTIKEKYPETILFFRLGDFYEMFYDDAVLASRELELTLTGKDCGGEQRAPMCGIPYHAIDSYLARLVAKGYKVAICEQLTPPEGRGIVEREVIRVVTPGTVTESTMLADNKNNYLASVYYHENSVGVSWTDITTGEFKHMLIQNQISVTLNDLLSRLNPSEIICNSETLAESVTLSIVKFGGVCNFSAYNDFAFDYETALAALTGQIESNSLNMLKSKPACICSAGALVAYIKETQKRALSHIRNADIENMSQYMVLDATARRTLELTESMNDFKRKGSLLAQIDKTSTSMGARLLRKWVEQPIVDAKTINLRLDFVEELFEKLILNDKLRDTLQEIFDMERLTGRLSYGNILPKDCLALSQSLKQIPTLLNLLSECKTPLSKYLMQNIKSFDRQVELIDRAIAEQPANNLRDGGIIHDGYDAQLDEYRNISTNAKSILAQLEKDEKEETGIKNLKISYNKVFGYYIEVLKSQLAQVPYRYIRKQTIAGGERFITEELKQIESKILSAESLSVAREQKLFEELIVELQQFVEGFLFTAGNIAYLDCVVSHALIARENNYVKPIINENVKQIKIVEGRHCVVEKLLKNEEFVPNDTLLDSEKNKIMLITGPNMAGKSIYMRQVALITILAHIGSFVPAKYAEISLTDRIFTRVGASDDLSTGRSTFMVEMTEVSQILQNATDNCLILMDEIGRGTSTYDGLSIAWSIIEFLSSKSKAKTLFSTHYHELTDLEGVIAGVKNYKLTVKVLINNTIIFLRKLMRGSANKSFGIEVASLAGLPEKVVIRAKELLVQLENMDIGRKAKMASEQQLSVFNNNCANEILSILKDIDLDIVSPRNALDILCDLKEKVVKNG